MEAHCLAIASSAHSTDAIVTGDPVFNKVLKGCSSITSTETIGPSTGPLDVAYCLQ